jgi:hypothetical protein
LHDSVKVYVVLFQVKRIIWCAARDHTRIPPQHYAQQSKVDQHIKLQHNTCNKEWDTQ